MPIFMHFDKQLFYKINRTKKLVIFTYKFLNKNAQLSYLSSQQLMQISEMLLSESKAFLSKGIHQYAFLTKNIKFDTE